MHLKSHRQIKLKLNLSAQLTPSYCEHVLITEVYNSIKYCSGLHQQEQFKTTWVAHICELWAQLIEEIELKPNPSTIHRSNFSSKTSSNDFIRLGKNSTWKKNHYCNITKPCCILKKKNYKTCLVAPASNSYTARKLTSFQFLAGIALIQSRSQITMFSVEKCQQVSVNNIMLHERWNVVSVQVILIHFISSLTTKDPSIVFSTKTSFFKKLV